MNKILFLIIISLNIFDCANLFAKANVTAVFLQKIEEKLFMHDNLIVTALKKVEYKLDKILQFHNSISSSTGQECCTKIDNVSKDIENIHTKIVISINKITTLTEKSNSQNVLLSNLFTMQESLERFNKQRLNDINKNLKRIKNDIEIISNDAINLNNQYIISSMNKIVTEAAKNFMHKYIIQVKELSTQLTRIDLNLKTITSIQDFESQSNKLHKKTIINNFTVENEYNRKKSFDKIMTHINTIENEFKNDLTLRTRKNEALYQKESEKKFLMRNIVDEILVKIKTIENYSNERHNEIAKGESELNETLKRLEIELQEMKYQNKDILKLLQSYNNKVHYYIEYPSDDCGENSSHEYTDLNDGYELVNESEQ
nr:putative leucine-rich repeat-containing protein DDB_G0290503 [Onthophagus taurus]